MWSMHTQGSEAMKDRRHPNDRRRAAFTLIELLVVIAVIALLIGILLPALGKARDASRLTLCISNARQFCMAANLYAQDHKDSIWDARRQIPNPGGTFYTVWARLPDIDEPSRAGPGLVYEYLSNADKVGECPTNKRRSVNGLDGQNVFNSNTALDFDYTMISRMHGAKLGMQTKVGYLSTPSLFALGSNPPEAAPAAVADRIKAFTGTPLFVEESTNFYNGRDDSPDYRDGLFSNNDQFETRHNGGCAVGFLEGHSEIFKAPAGGSATTEETGDLVAWDLYALGLRGWIRIEPADLNWARRPYGWINAPRQVALP